VLGDGSLLAYHPADRRLLAFDGATGRLARSVACEAVEAHAIVPDGDHVWIADCAQKLVADEQGEYDVAPPLAEAVGRVLLVDPSSGETARVLATPDDAVYAAGGSYLPTSVALDPDGRGLWIADGYGSNLIVLVSADGEVVRRVDGLDCPHGIVIDDRGAEPRLYIAERGRHRLVVLDLDGGVVREVTDAGLRAPCSMALDSEGRMFVTELLGRVTALDDRDNVLTRIGDGTAAFGGDGWPNIPAEPNRFVSPHGIAVGNDALYVSEWLLGGRWVRTPLP
jgi:sugar lactone lactonase YvrE